MRKGPDVFGMMFQSCREVVSHTSITTPTFSWERHLPFSLMMLLTVFAYAGCAPAALIRRRPGVRPRAKLIHWSLRGKLGGLRRWQGRKCPVPNHSARSCVVSVGAWD